MKKLTLICFNFIFLYQMYAQEYPTNITVTKDESMTLNDSRVIRASRTIKFESGFSADAGCYLFATLQKNLDDYETSMQTATASVNVYPNPANDKITVGGTYSNERAVIYDNTGNPVMNILLSGEDPEIDTTQLKNGEHILHAGDMKIRFIKLNE